MSSQFLLQEIVTNICELFHIEIADFITSIIQESSNLFFNIRSSCSHLILSCSFLTVSMLEVVKGSALIKDTFIEGKLVVCHY